MWLGGFSSHILWTQLGSCTQVGPFLPLQAITLGEKWKKPVLTWRQAGLWGALGEGRAINSLPQLQRTRLLLISQETSASGQDSFQRVKWRAMLQYQRGDPPWSGVHSERTFIMRPVDKGLRSFTAEGSANRVRLSWSLGATSPLSRFGAFKPLEVLKRHWFQHEMFAALCSAGMKRRGGKVASFLHSESRGQLNGFYSNWLRL